MEITNDNIDKAKYSRLPSMRQQLEELGYVWYPSYEECVRIVRRNNIKKGVFMSFEETAYNIIEGGLRENGVID